jgi:hypothetical protein
MIRAALFVAAGAAIIGAPAASAEPGAYSSQDEMFYIY